MRILTSQGVWVLFFVCFNHASGYKHQLKIDNSAFLEANVLEASNELSEIFLSELELFNSKVLEALADRLYVVFNRHGFDLNKRRNVEMLFGFLEDAEIPLDLGGTEEPPAPAKTSFKDRLLAGLKKAALGIGKEALLHATKAVVAFGVKEALPHIEVITKHALNQLPVNLKVAVAPMVFKMWGSIFKKAHVTPPPHFTLKHMILDGLSERDREAALELIGE